MTETPQAWRDASNAIAALDRLALYGPPGTGKTYWAMTAGLTEQTAYRVTCTEDMTTADLLGTYAPSGDGFRYYEGAAIRAWREGARLVLDEASRASGDVLAAILMITDSAASASWQNPHTGEVVRPADKFAAVITMNGEPDDLDPALRDRFAVAIRISEPHPDALATLPEHYREAARTLADHPFHRVSLRAFAACSKLESVVGLDDALRMTMPAEVATALRDAMTVSALDS